MNYFYTTQIFLRYSSNCGAEPMTVGDNFSLPRFYLDCVHGLAPVFRNYLKHDPGR